MSYSPAPTSTALRSTPSHPNGSRTITITADPTNEGATSDNQGNDSSAGAVLRLRGATNPGPRVAWDEDVVDNEHMGKKKSKICCIYHKPRRFDESSSDESSSDESDSSCGGEGHNHDHRRRMHRHNHRQKPRDRDVDGECDSEPETNAYERQPQKKGKGKP
ncbi:hypothetical protein NP233_g4736 [Leucocoprinus birnbaumii]|uniref:Type 1 phosphatases regulator n=1 Tax=Leucocoprinus birnbaumii TaxID=56174 RepID=A0AAD5VUA0_9AGAR|nr:hypothetical protein NP233_g4736 [Leucocoprinus birnbaumii]